jgi:hypothetical protein
MSTQDVAALFQALAAKGPPPVAYPAYLTSWDNLTGASVVQTSGGVIFTGLAWLGDPADITVGRVLLLNVGGKPIIVANLNTPG